MYIMKNNLQTQSRVSKIPSSESYYQAAEVPILLPSQDQGVKLLPDDGDRPSFWNVMFENPVLMDNVKIIIMFIFKCSMGYLLFLGYSSASVACHIEGTGCIGNHGNKWT
jgi:hypothetical protein